MPRTTCNEVGIVDSGSSASKLVSYSGHEIKTDVIGFVPRSIPCDGGPGGWGRCHASCGVEGCQRDNLVKRLFTLGCTGEGDGNPNLKYSRDTEVSSVGLVLSSWIWDNDWCKCHSGSPPAKANLVNVKSEYSQWWNISRQQLKNKFCSYSQVRLRP